MLALSSDVRYSFSGHEGFPFRYTWLTKAVATVGKHPDIFVRDDAPVVLGVGKNMARSIRHWSLALDLIEPAEHRGHVRVTPFGVRLSGPDGWDPYLEDIGTLWLLHWKLASTLERASTWCLAFTRWNSSPFARDELVSWLHDVAQASPGTRATAASLRRDVDVFIRSYVPTAPSREIPLEDTFDCPLVELGLVEEVDRGVYRFPRTERPSLPEDILLYSLMEFSERQFPARHSLSFETVQFAVGSPGAVFKLTETAMAYRLENLPSWTGLAYDETAGMRVIRRIRAGCEKTGDPIECLERYYTRLGKAE